MRRLPPSLLALPAYALSRLLPADGIGLALRLAAATAVLLLPGLLLARRHALPRASAALAWTLALLAAALAITFAFGGSLWLVLALYLGAGLVSFRHVLVPGTGPGPRWTLGAAAVGAAFGAALWRLGGPLGGDALFHLARVRKLDAFGSLSLRAVDEFRDGGLHPGYAFPLWHAFLALVSRLADVDPAQVVRHEATVLAALAFAVAFEAGAALFRSAWAGVAVGVAQVGLIALAPGHAGAYPSLALPATVAWQLLTPALLALVFTEGRSAAVSAAAAALALAFVHPTYAVFVGIVLVAYLVARALLVPSAAPASAGRLALAAVPVLAVLAWLAPLAREAAAQTPSRREVCRALRRYADEIHGSCRGHYHVAAELVSRRGALAVAALVVLPLAAFAARRRWSAFVLGGTLTLLALELVPFLFPKFASVVSISQARRALGFVPLAFALTGAAAVAARRLSFAVVPLALVAGVVLELVYPGNFGRSPAGAPTWPVWVAFVGGIVAALAALVLARRREPFERHGVAAALAVVALTLPVAVHGFAHWNEPEQRDAYALTPGLVRYLRTDVPRRSVVFSDLETSYRVAAFAPVYVAASPPAHVADTPANRPLARRKDVIRFVATGDLAIPRRYGADWLVVATRRKHPRVRLRAAYEDARFAVYRLR